MSKDVQSAATATASAGFPIFSFITVVLAIAKLTGHFSYSWWIVFLPLWGSTALGLLILALVIFFVILFVGVAAVYTAFTK